MPSKRMKEATALIDPKKLYTIEEAVALVKKTSTTKFDAAVELHTRLGIDPTKSDQQVRGTLVLPHGTGKMKRIAAFVEPEQEKEAKDAGAALVGGEELINQIAAKGVLDFDIAVATPKMMPKLAKLAKILGPRGMMPNPKTDTIGPNAAKMIQEQKAGKMSFKNDAQGNVHQVFGRASFDESKLSENLHVLIEAIRKVKPASSKGIYFRNVTIASTMGPGIKLAVN